MVPCESIVRIAEGSSLTQAEVFPQSSSSCDEPLHRTKEMLKYWKSSKDKIPSPHPCHLALLRKFLPFTELCFHQLFSNHTPKSAQFRVSNTSTLLLALLNGYKISLKTELSLVP